MKQLPASIWTLTVGIVVTLIAFWAGGHNGLFPEQASAQAPLVDNFFNLMFMIAVALFLLVAGTIIFFMIQFRQRPGDEGDGVPLEGDFALEAYWTLIPAVIVIVLGIYSVEVFTEMGGFAPGGGGGNHLFMSHHSHHKMKTQLVSDTDAPDASMTEEFNAEYGFGGTDQADVTVTVTGMQYAWIFNYPEQNVTAGELHIPVDKTVQLNIKAADVIHSFWVPQFRLKQDAIPGHNTELRFTATKVGDYPVVCAELCGGYHGAMRTRVYVHTQTEYDQWLAENQFAQNPDLSGAVAVHAEE
ncbi:cytochrome c oxidase, subunit II [Gloeomargarita lithophora Alchichica-D10]|uniref:Cytochrome c oxidase subunit 2 n=1 Tax=Gloeomargarita lithophora Alchichica-D10 TaxID=1188229 RepID=A0A1J0AA53_9CYAN|nr:cytochrome c oxidase subunit II [Gloeomargarita lithophora]APB32777.1 cytochrome c oxidase, subunit II [Gloeomargarita lithophora Alchichica-D10]